MAVGLIVASGLAAYSNSFTDLFAGLDGKESIRDNPHIRSIWPLSEALSLPLWDSPVDVTQTPTVALRPTFSASLAWTNYFFGVEPRAHHAVNLAIHIAAALVLFGIVRRTMEQQRRSRSKTPESTWTALAAALIWLLHPLQTESVTYIVQRCESLMGLLLFCTLYCSIRALDSRRRRLWQTGAVVACLLGTGSKETAAVAPILIFLYDYVFVSPRRTDWNRVGLYALLAVAAGITIVTRLSKVSATFDPVHHLAFVLAQPRVVMHYLALSVWPARLFLYVNTSVFDVHSAAQVWVPAAALVVLLAASVAGVIRRSWLGFVGAWFFVTLAPASSFLALTDIIQEHRMYVPLAGLAVLAAIAGAWGIQRLTAGLSKRGQATVGAAALAVVVSALGIRTYVRNWDYHHEFAMLHPADVHGDYTILADHYSSREGLIQAEADKARQMLRSPDADARDVVFAHFVLGLAHAHDDQLDDAVAEYRRVLELDPDFAYCHLQLGVVLAEQGLVAKAAEHFRRAIRIDPKLVYARKELALAMAADGDTTGAEEQLQRALLVQPHFGEGLFELGILALKRNDDEAALRYFEDAVRYRPDLADANYELGMLYMAQGDDERARERLTAAVRLRPDLAEAQKALGMVLARLGLLAQARRHLEQAVELRQEYAEAHNELAIVLRREGRLDAAADHLTRALELDPESADFHYQLGRLFIEKGETERAIEELRRTLALNPDHFAANYDLAEALVDSGDVSAARAYMKRAAVLRAQDSEAASRLDRLRKRIEDARSTSNGRTP